jgi:hypothetical protein
MTLAISIEEERLRRYPASGLVQSALFALRKAKTELEAVETLLEEHLQDIQPTKNGEPES